jgi:C-terminal processing protease CtpA/Prc
MYDMQHTNTPDGRTTAPVAGRHGGHALARIATLVLVCMATLAGCGGGGGGGGGSTGGNLTTNDPCSVTARNQWVIDTMKEWYLYPDLLVTSVSATSNSSPQATIDAMTATARAQNKDRHFTYLTSIAEENAFNSSGTTAGFGVRLYTDSAASRLYVTEAFEGAPARAAGIDRGDEILAIGTSEATLATVASLLASGGSQAVTDAIGPTTAGTTRTLQLAGAAGTRTLTVTKASYSLTPVSNRYGARILDDAGRKVGYLNLRTFISSADAQLRNAFASFRSAGINEVILDFRYNGGGLIATAELLGDLLGGNRSSGQIFNQMTFRPEKSANNSTHYFTAQPQAVAPLKLAFIATGTTASASELVVNGMLPYFTTNLALVGANTYGKPVGQVAIDRATCDDRLRVIAFALRNASGSENYFNGLAGTVNVSCRAADDFTHAMGDLLETSTRQALDFLAGRPCTAIAGGSTPGLAKPGGFEALQTEPEPLLPAQPSPAQREVPGLF